MISLLFYIIRTEEPLIIVIGLSSLKVDFKSFQNNFKAKNL